METCVGQCQVVSGRRYAAGIAVPFAAELIPGSPLADLQSAATGGALASDTIGGFLKQQGWSNAIVYPAGQSPFSDEPNGDHDYVVVATREGPSEIISTNDPAWYGALAWIADGYPDMEMPGGGSVQQPAPSPGPSKGTSTKPVDAGIPTSMVVGGVVVVVVGAALLFLAASTDDED